MIRKLSRKTFCVGMIPAMLIAFVIGVLAPACGTIRTHAGIEHEYTYDFDDYGHHKKHHKHPKKHHKKHHKHHHDDD